MSLIDNLKTANKIVDETSDSPSILLEPDWVSDSGATCRVTIPIADFEAMFPAAKGNQNGAVLRAALDMSDNNMEGANKVSEKGYRKYFDQWTTEGIMP